MVIVERSTNARTCEDGGGERGPRDRPGGPGTARGAGAVGRGALGRDRWGEQCLCAADEVQGRPGPELALRLQQLRDQPGPAGLVRSAEPVAVVAVEVLVEQHE